MRPHSAFATTTTAFQPQPVGDGRSVLVFSGPRRVVQCIGAMALFLVLCFLAMTISAGIRGDTGDATVGSVIAVLSVVAMVFALGLLLVTGRKIVVIEPAERRVTKRFRCIGYAHESTYRLDDFAAAGVAVAYNKGHGHYFPRLIGSPDLWVPGGGSEEDALEIVLQIAETSGLDVVAEPEPVSFFPLFG
ncbi:MAG: hypothetical protein OER86_07895 [Phycisphaerae bacterium]|nr:hypothetical protein [Phycisphaerae bacterium]